VNLSYRLRCHGLKLLGFTLSVLLLYLVFRKVNWAAMSEAFRETNYWIVLAGALSGLVGFFLRAVDWTYLLAPVRQFSALRLFSPVAIGYMTNNLLPARMGEFARAYVIGKREGVSKSSALATIIVERIFDGLTLLLILAVVSIFFEFPDWVNYGGFMVAGAFVGLSVLLVMVTIKVQFALRMVEITLGRYLPRMAERMKSYLESFVAGLAVACHARHAFLALVACMARWIFEACIYYSIAVAMGLAVPIHGVLFVMVVVNIATMVPSAPGYVGPLQLGCVVALSVFGVDETAAAAYSLLLHAAIFFPITIVGIVCLLRENLSWATLAGLDKALNIGA
jgi:uncharacterized protein (TIRG00374 family)